MGRTDGTAFITVVELFALQEAVIRPHILYKLILCLMLHAGFPPQAGYFWEISDKIVFSLLLSGNTFLSKAVWSFFPDEGLAIGQGVFTTIPQK